MPSPHQVQLVTSLGVSKQLFGANFDKFYLRHYNDVYVVGKDTFLMDIAPELRRTKTDVLMYDAIRLSELLDFLQMFKVHMESSGVKIKVDIDLIRQTFTLAAIPEATELGSFAGEGSFDIYTANMADVIGLIVVGLLTAINLTTVFFLEPLYPTIILYDEYVEKYFNSIIEVESQLNEPYNFNDLGTRILFDKYIERIMKQ